MPWYIRRILLRNCGRFLNLASDFGSKYKTHTFVSSEALYAGMTREQTRRIPKRIDLRNDTYNYEKYYSEAFEWKNIPIWFTPGVFLYDKTRILKKSKKNSDINWFNVLAEDYPSTNKGALDKKRPPYIPTYGSIESILPDNKLRTFAISQNKGLLERYEEGQTFLLGKKRTMFQIETLSKIKKANEREGAHIVPSQVQFEQLSNDFEGATILAATKRYLLVMGNYTKNVLEVSEFKFAFPIRFIFPYS